MQPRQNTIRNLRRLNAFHIKAILIGLLSLILTFYLTDLYLKQNFDFKGEAYMKGPGHLIRENFWKAVLFLVTRHLLVSTSCFFLLFTLVGREARRQIYNVLLGFAIAV